MARKKGKNPVGERRNAIAAAIRVRGQSPHNIWIIRPPFDKEDILLNSDIAMELFYYLEGDPSFKDINYQVLRTPVGSDLPPSIFGRVFAQVTLDDGTARSVVPCIENASEVAQSSPGDLRHYVTLTTLDLALQRTENWRRIIPCIRRVRLHSTAKLERSIVIGFQPGRKRSIREVLGSFSGENPGLVLGALAIVLRQRQLSSDLDIKPWSLNTILWSAHRD
jgi:hypothetical protein